MFEYIMNFFYGPDNTKSQTPNFIKTNANEAENKHQKPDGYKNINTSQSQSKN
jgi:hypothetical protein